MSFSVGQIISTVPEIQAADMANKSQLSDAVAYLRKAQRYHNGSAFSSVQNSLLPYACSSLEPPMSKEELNKEIRLPVRISQWIYSLILKQFNKSGFAITNQKVDTDTIERALSLWWAFDGREQKKIIKNQITATKDIRGTAIKSYVDFNDPKDKYTDEEKYRYLMIGKKKNE